MPEKKAGHGWCRKMNKTRNQTWGKAPAAEKTRVIFHIFFLGSYEQTPGTLFHRSEEARAGKHCMQSDKSMHSTRESTGSTSYSSYNTWWGSKDRTIWVCSRQEMRTACFLTQRCGLWDSPTILHCTPKRAYMKSRPLRTDKTPRHESAVHTTAQPLGFWTESGFVLSAVLLF